MKHLLICVLHFLCLSDIQGHTPACIPVDTSRSQTLRFYLVCEPTDSESLRSVHIIRNGDQVQVRDRLNRTATGTLKIRDAENLLIRGNNGQTDSFRTAALTRIILKGRGRKTFGGMLSLLGAGGLIGGLALISTDQSTVAAPEYYDTGGLLLALLSVPIGIAGLRISGGKKIKGSSYRFRVLQTRGFELKKKHLDKL